MHIQEHFVESADWTLHFRQTYDPAHLDRSRRPLVIVPGYGMNTFIFGFHPAGTSMERCFAEAGFEIWSVNLRGQGPSRPTRSHHSPPSLRAYAEVDLRNAIEAVLERTETTADKVDVIGASLGGSVVYAHLALLPQTHRIASVVTIGAPLRWQTLHPLLAMAFASPSLIGRFGFSGTRQLAQAAFPVLAKLPGVLSLYMNTSNIDLTRARDLTQTVDKVHPTVNRDIAYWVKARDMVLRGVNVTEGLRAVENPLLIVLGNRDGIVPPDAARAAQTAWGGSDVSVLEVGTPAVWYAHADLFVGREAPATVFGPISAWLRSRSF